MATERLLQELKVGDRPSVGLGNFQWGSVTMVQQNFKRAPVGPTPDIAPVQKQPAGQVTISQIEDSLNSIAPDPPLPADAWPLTLLEDKTFAGKGYNMIWRPRAKEAPPAPKAPEVAEAQVPGRFPDVLQVNLTGETTTFSKSLGKVPNRGKQKDAFLSGLSYVQRVGAFEDAATGLDNAKEPAGIHFEPGCLMFVPASKSRDKNGQVVETKATINRMGSIPHGTTINAQGLKPLDTQLQKGPPVIPRTDITPFSVKDGSPNTGFPHLNFTGNRNDILPISKENVGIGFTRFAGK